MNRSVLLILVLLLFLAPSAAQFNGVDTLFKANELICFSSLERKALRDFLDGKPDYLAMIAAVNPDTDERELELYRNWINEIIAEISARKFDKLSGEGKIERIKKHVSKSLLINYKYKANFDDLFRNGDYNYFTAAALYAFLLERFEIPYEIHEMPTHIYLTAHPGDRKVSFETTKPGFQYFMFEHETRSYFVDFIHNQGVIDDLVYQNTNTRDLFQQYFFADYGLSIREMVGMLYINSAVELSMMERKDDSYAQLEKAFILYPSYKSQYMLLVQLNNYIRNMDYHNLAHLGYLIKASRLIGYGVERDRVEYYLRDIVDKILVKEEDQEGFEYIYEYLQGFIQDEDLKKNFTFHYLYESGRLEFLNARYSKALDFLEPAYELRPEDKRTQDLLARSLGGYSLTISPSIVLEKINDYDTAYGGVTDEGIYLQLKLQTYLVYFGDAFQLQDYKTGELYMAEFEKLQDSNPGTSIDNILVGRSYSSAAIYYYRKGNLTKSKQVIEKGLTYAPDNIELKLKLAAFE